MKYKYLLILVLSSTFLLQTACRKNEGCTDVTAINYDPIAEKDDGSCEYETVNGGNNTPTPYTLSLPPLFAQYLLPPVIPSNNPLTVEGVALGKKLFFDPILSANNTQACADCHMPEFAFTDTAQFSIGIDGLPGTRNSMPIFNVAWNNGEQFFWDGRASSVENQAFGPVVNPVEMHNTWPNAVAALQAHPQYPQLFQDAFGTSTIDSVMVTKALAQFERTLISGNAKFDKYLLGLVPLTPQEASGFNIFMDENAGDCFHCHGNPNNPLWTDNDFHNNGLDSFHVDKGLELFTGNPNDRGKFKSPSLRNLVYTAPYMHDGRFKTIDEVIDHYSEGLKYSSTIDPLMKKINQGGVQLTPAQKSDLKAFLLTLTDSDFVTNPNFKP